MAIKAVFFDLYNTLVRFWPPVEEIQARACAQLGVKVEPSAIKRGYGVADQFFNRENAMWPISLRPAEARQRFFIEYEESILKGAGLTVSPKFAEQVWAIAGQTPKQLAPYDDAAPTLTALKEHGLTLGVLSNIRRDLTTELQEMGLAQHLEFWVTSEEVGAEKPAAPIFLAALERARAKPAEAVHVGDQYESDVLGARGVGIHAVLLDRNGLHTQVKDCQRIDRLSELIELVRNDSF